MLSGLEPRALPSSSAPRATPTGLRSQPHRVFPPITPQPWEPSYPQSPALRALHPRAVSFNGFVADRLLPRYAVAARAAPFIWLFSGSMCVLLEFSWRSLPPPRTLSVAFAACRPHMDTGRSAMAEPSGLVGDALQAAAGTILTKGDANTKLMDADRAMIMNYVRCEARIWKASRALLGHRCLLRP